MRSDRRVGYAYHVRLRVARSASLPRPRPIRRRTLSGARRRSLRLHWEHTRHDRRAGLAAHTTSHTVLHVLFHLLRPRPHPWAYVLLLRAPRNAIPRMAYAHPRMPRNASPPAAPHPATQAMDFRNAAASPLRLLPRPPHSAASPSSSLHSTSLPTAGMCGIIHISAAPRGKSNTREVTSVCP